MNLIKTKLFRSFALGFAAGGLMICATYGVSAANAAMAHPAAALSH